MTEPSGNNADAPADAPVVSAAIVTAALATLAAAWLAAGSTGLLAHPLRHALCWLCVVVAAVAAWPPAQRRAVRTISWLAAALVVALLLSMTAQPVPNVMAVALVVAALAWAREGLDRRVLLIAAICVAVLGVYRLAFLSIPAVWLASDALGRGLGLLGGSLSGRPLWIGATFGGVDFLVLMGTFYGLWLAATPAPRRGRALRGAVAIVAAQLTYLFVLSLAADIISALPVPPPAPDYHTYVPPPWHWSTALRTLLPWNLPLLAAGLQLLVAAAMLRWTTWAPVAPPRPHSEAADSPALKIAMDLGPALLALAVPLLTVLAPGTSDLAGRKIVAYQQGRLDPPEQNWTKPEHGRYGRFEAGLYGMLPDLVDSLGGEFALSTDLTEEDFEGADLLVLLHPVRPWTDQQLERIDRFVTDGGSVLVAAETRIQDGDLASSFNDLLEGTAMRVRFDMAIYETDQWQHARAPIPHPATIGLGDRRNLLGVASGSSVEVRWPARPVLAGSWGWGDPGSDAALTNLSRYDSGEKLGDLVLAAEQRRGRGTIFVLGDAAAFSNETLPRSYRFVARLLGYLANHGPSPQTLWRQAAGLVGCALLILLLVWQADPTRVAVVALLLASSTGLALLYGGDAAKTLPDGRSGSGRSNLVYVDTSHMPAFDDARWSNEGIDGFLLTLMQNNYLPLELPELTKQRLDRAGTLVLIAPSRHFSAGQQQTIVDFVEGGGRLICMAGAEDAAPLKPLLEKFDFAIPPSPAAPSDLEREPEPVGETPTDPNQTPEQYGRFATNYLNAADYGAGDYRLRVWIFAGWPIQCQARDHEVLVRGFANVPLAIARSAGSGHVVVIGDTGFVWNQNMGYAAGQPVVGVVDNAHFWRWMLSRVGGAIEWIPPEPAPDPVDEEPEEEEPGDMPDDMPDGGPEAGPRLEPPENLFPGVPEKEAAG